MILKPSVQPPFDFPAISYILYKGIDPASLLAADGTIDSAQEADSDLISAIKSAWELEANGNTGSPTRACIGLHLNPTDYPEDDNPERFADTEPLDRFFYEGDPVIQLPLVRGGGRLGTFSGSLPFGIEIVVERIGRRPNIALTRKIQNIVEVDTLAATASPSEVFLHWHAKEEILDFIDPCAFWGSFFARKLRVWDSDNEKFDKLSSNAIYETLLRGTTSGAAKFANRNRAYIDIRNEHGNSLNYYQADGPNIQLTLDPDADIDASEVNYYASGWPSFFVDSTNLPAGTTGDKIDVRFTLPKTATTCPLIYISAGYRDEFRRLKDEQRFLSPVRRFDVPYLEAAAVTIPLVDDSGMKVTASYQKLFSFKRPLIVDDLPLSVTGPTSLEPTYTGLLDYVFQVLEDDALPLMDQVTVQRTFGEERYVANPTGEYGGFVARLTVVQDATNRYWILTPHAYYRWPGTSGVSDGGSGSPAIAFSNRSHFLVEYAARKTPRELLQVAVEPPQDALSQSPVEVVIAGQSRSALHSFAGRSFERTLILCVPKNDIQQLFSDLASVSPLPGSVFLVPGPAKTFESGARFYNRSVLSAAYLKTVPIIARETVLTSVEIYADANL